MKKVLIALFVIANMAAASAVASDRYRIFKWGEAFDNEAITYSYSNKTYISTTVTKTVGGRQRIYFAVGYIDDAKKICPSESINQAPTKEVWTFNGKTIEMEMTCTSGDRGKVFLSATASRKSGANTVVKMFKESSENIRIDADGMYFPVSAKGFSAEWRRER